MKIRHIALIAGVAAVSLGGLVAFAEPHAPRNYATNTIEPMMMAELEDGEGEGFRFGEGRLIQELDLSADQQKQIQGIKENYRTEMDSLWAQMRPLREEMRTLMVGTADQNTIRAKHQEAQSLQSKIQDTRFEQMLAIREVLTPAQRQKFADIMDQKRDQMGERGRMGGDNPGQGNRPRLRDGMGQGNPGQGNGRRLRDR